jgi:hypothetical protein
LFITEDYTCTVAGHRLIITIRYVGNTALTRKAEKKIHNQIDHILVDRRRHSSVLDVRSFRAADCDNDHYLVVAKVRERLAVNKQSSQRFNMEKFNLKLNDIEGKEQFRVEVSSRFAALEDLDTEVEKINSAWETIRENIKISAKDSLS